MKTLFATTVVVIGTFFLLTVALIYLNDKYFFPYLLGRMDAPSAAVLITILFSIYISFSLLYIGYIAVRDRHK